MKYLILIALALSLSANDACEIAKADYDRSFKLYKKEIQKKKQCDLLVNNLGIIIKECEYLQRTKRIIRMMRDSQQLECGLVKK
jgi:short-subunit dehydrogenase